MKIGPLDLNQPSTWRGLLGFAGVIGLSLHPELRDQIAVTLAAVLCLIEMIRDEYRAQTAKDLTPTATATTTGPARPAHANPGAGAGADSDAVPQRLRTPARADPQPTFPDSNSGFGDR